MHITIWYEDGVYIAEAQEGNDHYVDEAQNIPELLASLADAYRFMHLEEQSFLYRLKFHLRSLFF